MRKIVGILAALLISASLGGVGSTVLTPSPAAALDNGLARTPYMGWNTYYGLGGNFNDQTIKSEADAIVSRGLKDAGYRYVWLDGGWWSGTRDANGNITVDPQQWPNGMRGVADYIHSKGLLAGIYTDAGANGCGGANQGSYGRYQQDVNQFASWGFDAVKVDYCGGTEQRLDPAKQYGQFRDAILHNASGRPMLLNICNPFTPGQYAPGYPPYDRSAYNSYSFGPTTGNSWRTDTDIGFVHNIQFRDVLRNLDANNAHPEAAGPGHWNDPDYLGPELGMTSTEAQTQFSMWTISAAPLIIGSDIRALSQQSITMLTNPEVIAISQDARGVQGTPISTQGNGQVWVKPLANGDRAVALLNRGTTAQTISTDASTIGMPHASRYTLRDVWNHSSTESAGRIAAAVPPHAVVMYRISAKSGHSLPPAVVLSPPVTPAAYPGSDLRLAVPGQALPVSVTFENNAREPLRDVRMSLNAPPGWSLQPAAEINVGTLPGRHSHTATWSVTPPPGTLPGTDTLTATTSYTYDGHQAAQVTSDSSVTVPATPPADLTYLSDQTWLDATSGYLVPRLDAEVGGQPMRMQGQTYRKGIGVASPSQIDFYVGGRCSGLSSTIGIDDIVNQVGPQGGTATFQVYADGRKLYDSGAVDRTSTRQVNVDITGADVLTLVVGDAGDGGYNDRADWGNLQVSCEGPAATVPSGPWPHYVSPSAETASATSANSGYPASYAVDTSRVTFWHTQFSPVHDPLPQSITVDLGATRNVDGLTYQTRLDGGTSGIITGYRVELSADGVNFAPVAVGSWSDDTSIKSVTFDRSAARFVRLTATSGVADYANAADIRISDMP